MPEAKMSSNSTKLFDAIRAGDLGQVQSLIDGDSSLAGARNETGVSALLTAVYSGKQDIRDLLLAKSGPLELCEAVVTGHRSRVEELVQANPALARSFSADGFPVVALAAFFGQLEITRYLAEQGADLNAAATNGTGYNALTGAVTSGHTEIVKWLLETGANPNYTYGPGYTPLLSAAANGGLDIVKLLLAHGAKADAQTNDGKSAVDLAEERKHQAIIDFLKSR